LYRTIPLLQGIRATNRIGYLVIVAVSMLAGFGVAAIRQRWHDRRWLLAASIVLVAAVNAEQLRAPFSFRRFDGISSIYDRLASERRAVVVEMPVYPHQIYFGNARYMLNSTRHWKPLVNGYSAFIPPAYYPLSEVLTTFPSEQAVRALRAAGVTHVFVHDEAYPVPPGPFDGLTLIDSEGQTSLYRVTNIHP